MHTRLLRNLDDLASLVSAVPAMEDDVAAARFSTRWFPGDCAVNIGEATLLLLYAAADRAQVGYMEQRVPGFVNVC